MAYRAYGDSFIEGFAEGLKFFVATADASQPPSTQETSTVAHQLYEGGRNTEYTYPQTAVLNCRVDKNDKLIEQDGKVGQRHQCSSEIGNHESHVAPRSTAESNIESEEQEEKSRQEDGSKNCHPDGEDSRQQMHQFQAFGVFLIEVDVSPLLLQTQSR